MKKFSFITFILCLVFTSFFCTPSCAETITLVTYYPAPFAIFKQLRIMPGHFDSTATCDAGTIRVDAYGRLWVCLEAWDGLGNWGSGPSIGLWEQNGDIIYPASTETSTETMVGIGTKTPEFTLDLRENGGIIARGTVGSGKILTTEGAGTRFFWYPYKAALRAGQVDGEQWNDDYVAPFSTAIGQNTVAAAVYATAIGNSTVADGRAALALGKKTLANGFVSLCIGDGTRNNSFGSLSIGQFNLGGGTPDTWVDTDPVFEIGNGTSELNRSNVLTARKNGDIAFVGTMGIRTPAASDTLLHVKTTTTTDLFKLTSNGATRIILKPNSDSTKAFLLGGNQSKFIIAQLSGTGDPLVFCLDGGTGRLGLSTEVPASQMEVIGDVYINEANGKLIMHSPDGTCSSCGPDNANNWSCTSIGCPVGL